MIALAPNVQNDSRQRQQVMDANLGMVNGFFYRQLTTERIRCAKRL